MDLNGQKQEFSIAYVHALAAAAGIKLDRYTVDDDSLDVLLSRAAGRSPHLSLQLKCSADIDLRPNDFSFRIKLKNYIDLRRPGMVPKVLTVLHVPAGPGDWVIERLDHILLHHRAYWVSLLGAPEILPSKSTDGQEKKPTVVLPRANILSPASLLAMMDNKSLDSHI